MVSLTRLSSFASDLLSKVGMLAAAIAGSGCHIGLEVYEPEGPSRSARDPQVEIVRIVYRRELERSRESVFFRVVLRIGERVRMALVDAAHTPPCSGPGASAAFVAERRTASGRVVLFEQSLSEPDGPMVLDVEIVNRFGDGILSRCIRTPLADASLRFRRVAGSNAAVHVGARLEVPVRTERSLNAVAVAPIGVVYRTGRFRLGVASGIGAATCDRALCGERLDENGNEALRGGPVLPLETSGEYLLGSGATRFGLGARYALRVAFTPDAPGERRHVIHAPHAALVWKWARPERPAGWPEKMPAFSLGVELPIGLWHDATSGETSWFAGFGLTSAWPMF